ncbi:MAG: hypothetical protein AB7I48_06995 [Planctomycetaceae bacterium]
MPDSHDDCEGQTAGIDVTAAIKSAAAYLVKAFKDEAISDVRLEEVEFVDSKSQWAVTLSFLRKIPSQELPVYQRQFAALEEGGYRRDYKTVQVDAETGECKSIKIRVAV